MKQRLDNIDFKTLFENLSEPCIVTNENDDILFKNSIAIDLIPKLRTSNNIISLFVDSQKSKWDGFKELVYSSLVGKENFYFEENFQNILVFSTTKLALSKGTFLISQIKIASENDIVSLDSDFESSKNNKMVEYQNVFDNSPNKILFLDKKFKICNANTIFLHFHYQVSDLEIVYGQTHYLEIVPEFLRENYKEILKIVERGEKYRKVTFRSYPGKNLPEKYFEEFFSPAYNKEGIIIGYTIYIRNITDEKILTQRLEESDATMRTIFDCSYDEIAAIDRNFKLLYFNKVFEDVYKQLTNSYPEEGDNIITKFENVGLSKLANRFKKRYLRALEGEKFTDTDFFESNGKIVYKEIFLSPIYLNNEIIGVGLFGRDVTSKMESERFVRENQAYLNRIQSLAKIGSWKYNFKDSRFEWSHYCYEIFELKANIPISYSQFLNLLGYVNSERIKQELLNITSGDSNDLLLEIKSKSGKIKYLNCSLSSYYDDEGNIIEVIGFIQDITQLKLSEVEISRKNALLESVIDNLPFDFWVRDREERMIIQNEYSKLLWGDLTNKSFAFDHEYAHKWKENNKKAFDGNIVKGTFEYKNSDKKLFYEELIAPIKENGNIIGIIGLNIDVTEKHEASVFIERALNEQLELNRQLSIKEQELSAKEEELRQSLEELISVNEFIAERESLISTIFDNSPDLILSIDTSFRVNVANKVFRNLYKKVTSTDFVVGANIFDVFHLENYKYEYKTIYEEVLKGKTLNRISDKYDDVFGRYVSDEYYTPIKDEHGLIKGLAIFIKDITEKVLLEEENKKNEVIYQSVLDSSNDIFSFVDNDFIFRAANQNAINFVKRFTGKDLIVGITNVKDVVRPEYIDIYKEHLERAKQGEYLNFELKRETKNPEHPFVYTDEYFHPVRNDQGKIIGAAVFTRDITEKIESQIRNNTLKSRFETVINSSKEFITLINSDYTIAIANQAYIERIKKYYNKIVEFDKTNVWDVTPTYLHEKYRDIFHKSFRGETCKIFNKRTYAPNDEVLYTEETITPIYDVQNNITAISIFAEDVTERIKAQEEMIDNELRFTSVMNSNKDGIILINKDYKLVAFNDSYKTAIKNIYNIDLVPNKHNALDLLSPQFHNKYIEIFEEVLSGNAKVIEQQHNFGSGNITYTEEVFYPIFNSKKEVNSFSVFIRNVTEKVELFNKIATSEQQLNIAQNLAQLGSWCYDYTNHNIIWSDTMYEIFETPTSIEIGFDTYLNYIPEHQKLEARSKINKAMKTGEIGEMEFSFVSKKGFIKILKATVHPIYDIDNKFTSLYGIIQDITDFKNQQKAIEESLLQEKKLNEELAQNKEELTKNEAQLKSTLSELMELNKVIAENEQMLRISQEVANLGGWKYDLATQLVRWSPQTYKIFEVDESYILTYDNYLKLLSDEMLEDHYKNYEENITKGKEYQISQWLTTQKGNRKYIMAVGKPIFNVSNELVGFYGSIQDLTLLKEVEIKLQNSLFEAQKLNESLALSEEELTANEEELRTYVEELSAINKKLYENENYLRITKKLAKLGDFRLDISKQTVEFSEESMQIFDLEVNTFSIDRLKEILSADNVMSENNIMDTILNSKSESKIEFEFYSEIHKKTKHTLINWFPVRDRYGNLIEILGAAQDLSEYKETQQKIEENEMFLNRIIENTPIGIGIHNYNGNLIRFNKAHQEIYNIPINFSEKNPNYSVFTSRLFKKLGIADIMTRVREGEVIFNNEFEIDFSDTFNQLSGRDSNCWLSITAFPIFKEGGFQALVVMTIDITEAKQNEFKAKESTIQLIESNKKMAEYRLIALRSVMNPHFLFNSLNSIQYFIAKNDREQALNYLSLFSKLIRLILNSSVKNAHTLSDEINVLKFYTDLEILRFENKFDVDFIIDEDLDQENVEIPSLLLQPYVENAILHGLYNKEEKGGKLKIEFKQISEDELLVTIEDNGVGRAKAQEIKDASNLHRSVGMLVTQERLDLINNNKNLSVKITDLKNAEYKPIGTRIEVFFKF